MSYSTKQQEPDSGQASPSEKAFAVELNRRGFLKSSAFVGGAAALSQIPGCHYTPGPADLSPVGPYPLADPENLIYSTCLQCHVDCPIKAKMLDGGLAKISGSPYSPQNLLPHLPFETPIKDAANIDAKLCAKGQAGIQTYYDPYRLRKVLKRAGPRGSNKWQVIEYADFIDEVVNGGQIFADIGETRSYPGFDEVYALRDRAVAKVLAADAKSVAKGGMTVGEFKAKHAANLDKLIDPDHPDLGPKNNGLVLAAGRIEHGRKELAKKWFLNESFGSVNDHDHTSICEQSHHIAYDEMTGGATHHMKPDLANCEFVIFWGTGAFTANFGLTPMAEKVTEGMVSGRMKTAVIDPRLSNDAGKANFWLPVKPGSDAVLAFMFMRWMFENDRFDSRYLAAANRAAANAHGEPTFTNATHLIVVEGGRPSRLLSADEAGLGESNQVVVMQGGVPIAVDPDGTQTPVEADLFVDSSVAGHQVKTSLQLLREEAFTRNWEAYEDETGISLSMLEPVVRELTSHGKRAAVEMYRGPVQHTDGFYAGAAIITLNILIGNADWKGGLSVGGGHWHEFGGKEGNIYNIATMHPGKTTAFGPRITRDKARYEDSTLFAEHGYPAKRPWYPLSSNVYQEIIPSFATGYPYPGKILFLHMGTPALASPAGTSVIPMLMDPDRVPLFIACDIVIGETSMYADYILPDLTYLERWGTPHVTPDINTMTSKVRQPVGFPLTEEVEVDGERMPISLESFIISIGKRLGMPGFGKDGLGPGLNFDRPEDWYLKAVANMAVGDKVGDVVPDADDSEMSLFRRARRHLPPSVFDEAKWKAAVPPELWRKVVYVLNRGGRYAPPETSHSGEFMKKKFGKMFHLWMGDVAAQRHSMTGEFFPGLPTIRGQRDAMDRPLDRDGRYPFSLITYKEAYGGHSRTISNYWSNIALKNENTILMHRRDAEQLGLKAGQRARLVSASSPTGRFDLGDGRQLEAVGKVELREGIRPGVVGVSWHYGHWAYGSNDVEVDGDRIEGDHRRAAGLCPNMVMALDPVVEGVCLTDPVGASASFFDTKVRVVPV